MQKVFQLLESHKYWGLNLTRVYEVRDFHALYVVFGLSSKGFFINFVIKSRRQQFSRDGISKQHRVWREKDESHCPTRSQV